MTRRTAWAIFGLTALALAVGFPWLRAGAAGIATVIQAHRAFNVAELHIKRGDTVHFTNDDAFNHQVYVKSPSFSYESEEQAPGQAGDVTFPKAGTFDVLCEIHPRMHLAVTVD